MKKRLLGLLLVLVMICGVCFTACQNNDEVLKSVLFQQNEQVVTSEFELPATVGGKEVTWTSNNAAVKLEKTEDGSAYVAKINPPEDKQVVVTLTVTLGSAKKEFTVKVNPIDVEDIADEYIFAQQGMLIKESFNLDAKATFNGKEATITWSVETESHKDFIEVKDGKCLVNPTSLNPEVELTATFSYKGETTKRIFRFTVSIEMSHLEEIDFWYNNTGVVRDLKGYVVGVAEAYTTNYGNMSFYMLDEDLNAGYYIYRLYPSEAEAAKIVPGVYVEISGKPNTVYNGLYETTAEKNATYKIDETKKINVEDYIYALDNDLLSGSDIEKRHTGTLVSLTNWTVKSKNADKNSIVLEKGGKEITVINSKYMASFYTSGSDADTALCNKIKSFNAGDVVSVTGVLSNYNGNQILPRKADDVVAGTAEADGTVHDGAKVGAAFTALKTAINTNGLAGVIVANDEVTLPTTHEGVTLKYELCSASNSVTLEGGKFTIVPGKMAKVNVKVELTSGDYTATVFFAITTNKMSDADIVAAELNALSLTNEITKVGDTTLRTKGATYTSATIEWAIVGETALAKVEDGKLKVTALPEEDTVITVQATVTNGDKNDKKEFSVTIKAAPKVTVTKVDPAQLAEGKAYKLVIDQTQLDKQLYVLNNMDGYNVASTESLAEAADIYVEKVDGGVKLYFLKGETKNYLGALERTDKAGSYNIKLDTETVWTVTAECIKTTIGTTDVYVGTYDKYSTFSISKTTFLSTSFAAYLAEVTEG